MEAEGQGVTPGRVPPSSLPGWLWSPGDLTGWPVSQRNQKKKLCQRYMPTRDGDPLTTQRGYPHSSRPPQIPLDAIFPGQQPAGSGWAVLEPVSQRDRHLHSFGHLSSTWTLSPFQDLLTPVAEIPPEIPADTVPTGAAVLASGTARPQHPSVGSPMPAACWALLLELWVPLHSLWTSGKLPQFAPVAANSAAGARPSIQGVL